MSSDKRTQSETPRQRVLARYPKAYARYVGLSLRFVVVADHRGPELSKHKTRERDAWTDAARHL